MSALAGSPHHLVEMPFQVTRAFGSGAAVVVAAVLTACTALTPTPASPRVPSFSYQLEPMPEVLTVGEPLRFEWAPHPDPNFTTKTADLTLCIAIFGAWSDVATLKREGAALDGRPTCPPTGAVAISETVRATTAGGPRLTAAAPALSRPGFYNVRQIMIFGPVPTDAGSVSSGSQSADRIVEVRAR